MKIHYSALSAFLTLSLCAVLENPKVRNTVSVQPHIHETVPVELVVNPTAGVSTNQWNWQHKKIPSRQVVRHEPHWYQPTNRWNQPAIQHPGLTQQQQDVIQRLLAERADLHKKGITDERLRHVQEELAHYGIFNDNGNHFGYIHELPRKNATS